MSSNEERIRKIAGYIAVCPNFPKKGVNFKDMWPLLQNPEVFGDCIDLMTSHINAHCGHVDVIVGLESRGFVFGPLIAQKLRTAFVPIRKKGKLPGETAKVTYQLEYGEDCFEMQKNAIQSGQRVVVVDDLLATGGTMRAACDLVSTLGGDVVQCVVLMELTFLDGRSKLSAGTKVKSFITYEE